MNEAVERAHREGILAGASLMVGAPAAADAVRRARRMPSLCVGLHLVVIEGAAVLHFSGRRTRSPKPLPQGEEGLLFPLPLAEGGRGEGFVTQAQFPRGPLRLGLGYAFHPLARRRLAAEIRAQFAAFAQTGLSLDHVNAHKHMHLHPRVGHLMLEIGREYGLRAIRVPAEPPGVLAACGHPVGLGERALYRWSTLLRRRARRAGVATNDHAFGLAWSGHMTVTKLLRLAPLLPEGVSEIYLHPASRRDPALTALMPDYEHEAELAALLDPRVRTALADAGAAITSFGAMAASGR